MTTLLEVYWNKNLTGQLWLSNDNMQFEYSESWLNNPKALPLSKRLPLQKGSFPSDRVKIFFCNLLPEEELKKRLSKQYGISEDNYFGLLENIGGECAGALSILPKSFSLSQESSYEELSNQQLNNMIDNRAGTPLIMSHQNIRMSLAGTQDKLPAEGGYVSLKRCCDFIRKNSSYPQKDIVQLIKWILFNLIIGNCDAHAKNLSLLIYENGYYTLAPFYDILSTAVYPRHTQTLAMKIGGDYFLKNINRSRLEKLATDIQMAPALIQQTSIDLCGTINKQISETA